MAEIQCPTCGRANADDHNFCDYCAAPLFSLEPLPPDSPSLRDDIFDQDGEVTPSQPAEPTDEASRLDSLLTPDEPLERTPPAAPLSSAPRDDSSRLDDLIPAPQEPRDESGPGIDQESDPASRLDELFAGDDSFPDPLPGDAQRETPQFDPFQDPLTRDALLGDESPPEKPGDAWDFLAEPPAGETTPASETVSEWESLTGTPSGDAAPPGEPASEWDLLSEPSTGDATLPGEPASEWDLLSEPSTGDAALSEEPASEWDLLSEPAPGQSTSAEDAGSERDFLSGTLPGESPSATTPESEWDFLTEPSVGEAAPAEEPGSEWDFLTSPAEDSDSPRQQEAGPDIKDPWDFLASPEDGEKPSREDDPAAEAEDPWDFLTGSGAEDEQPPSVPSPADPVGDPEFLEPREEGFNGEKASPTGPSGEWDFLTPDPGTEPVMMGFSPDIDDEDDDPIPDFGSPGFSDDSGWLDMLQDPETRAAAEAEAAAQAKPEKPQTDWLDKIKRLNKSSELVDKDSSFPDWLSVSEKPADKKPEETRVPEQAPPEPGEAAPANELPGWLNLDSDDETLSEFLRKKDLTNEEYKPAIKRGITDKLPPQDDDEDKPASGLSDSQQIKFPSWANEKTPAQKIPEDLQFLAGQEEKSRQAADPFQMEEEEFFDDLFSEELPGWLTSASSTSAFEDIEEELSHGELPGWVEAMRPVVESSDTTGLSEDDDYIENYGPLAGIPSVLPAEAEGAFDPEQAARKPLDLLATKSHQDYVNILKKLIAEENKTKTILKPAPIATQRVLRWLIAIIMLVTTAGTVIFGGVIDTQAPSPAQVQNSGYIALYNQIESLYDGQPVLIAHDYQPAAAGELHTAAAGVVDHLMKQGTYLSFVSTVPTGPALAEHFLAATQEEHNYLHTQQYINLGYLPGEAAGLLSFVIAPKQIIPLAYDGSNAWGAPPLLKVDSINDFAMVLVITDDPDTAKIWIEQVGTILKNTPLTMVVSAQVEPLIQPYFRSSPQLLKGYVAGIIDSMNYEQRLGRPNLATAAWLPFNMGIIITVGTIFIGGLANGVLSLFSRRKTPAAGDNK